MREGLKPVAHQQGALQKNIFGRFGDASRGSSEKGLNCTDFDKQNHLLDK